MLGVWMGEEGWRGRKKKRKKMFSCPLLLDHRLMDSRLHKGAKKNVLFLLRVKQVENGFKRSIGAEDLLEHFWVK